MLQRKRGIVKSSQLIDAPPATHPKRGHWSYLLAEAAWMCQDVRQERLWKKKMAFLFAHLIASSSPFKLRPVAADQVTPRATDGSWLSTRRISRQKCAPVVSAMFCVKRFLYVRCTYDYSFALYSLSIKLNLWPPATGTQAQAGGGRPGGP